MSTREQLDLAAIVGEAVEIPCEARRHKGETPAEWILWTVKCCRRRVARGFICTTDLNHFLTTENAVVCDQCGARTQPARLDIVRFEAIDSPAK